MSKKLMPASRAASTTGGTSSSCMPMPKLLVPSPTTDTSSEPIGRLSMEIGLPPGDRFETGPDGPDGSGRAETGERWHAEGARPARTGRRHERHTNATREVTMDTRRHRTDRDQRGPAS